MQFPQRAVGLMRKSMLGSLTEGIGYLRRHESLGTLVLLATVPMVFGMSYIYILPVFARDILHIGADGNAFLVAGSGVGGFAAALAIASAHSFRRRGWLMLIGLAIFGGSLILFAESRVVLLSLIALFGAGVGQMCYMATNNTLVQEIVDPDYRGRVLSTLSLNIGFVPLGTALASAMIKIMGAPSAEAVMGASLVVTGLYVALRVPRVRDLP